jgi:aminoglycoside phosphotransferase (APT) family kinase protein
VSDPTHRYLSAIREACQSASRSVENTTDRRTLEQVCQLLTRLMVDAKVVPDLQAEAAAAYGALLHGAGLPADGAGGAGHPEFERSRATAQALLRSANTPFAASVVEIERNYFRRYEDAFQQEAAASATGSPSESRASGAPDPAALGAYLSGVFGATVEVSRLDTVALGFSKATLLVSTASQGRVPDVLVVRMDRPFNYLGTTVADEFPVLQVLHAAGVPVPRPYAMESTGSVLGHPFMVMERVFGNNLGSHFRFPEPDPAMCVSMAQTLAAIHSIPVEHFGDILKGSDQSAEEQLAGEIDKFYRDWSELDAVSPVIEAAFQWLRHHMHEAIGERTLVHGDFSLSNLLIDDRRRVSAILDWEFARLGSPASDLGWFYIAATRLGGWELFLDAYQRAGGPRPGRQQLDYHVLWGALRLAIMNYQVACGFDSGRSTDLKHAYAGSTFMRECVLRVGARLSELLSRS